MGTGRIATPEQAQSVHVFIRNRIAKRDEQAADCVLVGRASLDANEFIAICQAANKVTHSAINSIAERDKLIPVIS